MASAAWHRPSAYDHGGAAAYVDQPLIAGRGGVHHVRGRDHFKTTPDALGFKRGCKRRADPAKRAMEAVPAGDRAALVEAITGAVRQGGSFSVDVGGRAARQPEGQRRPGLRHARRRRERPRAQPVAGRADQRDWRRALGDGQWPVARPV